MQKKNFVHNFERYVMIEVSERDQPLDDHSIKDYLLRQSCT